MGVKPLRQKYAKAFIAVQNIAKTKNDDLFHEISIHLCGSSAAFGGQATQACFCYLFGGPVGPPHATLKLPQVMACGVRGIR